MLERLELRGPPKQTGETEAVGLEKSLMDFEVIFRLEDKELARYQFAVETPADIQAGFINALDAFRVQYPEVDLLEDGMLMLIRRRAR